MARQTSKEKTVNAIKFSKQQLIKSKAYAYRQDALHSLLKDVETYTHEEVEKILEDFYEGGKK